MGKNHTVDGRMHSFNERAAIILGSGRLFGEDSGFPARS